MNKSKELFPWSCWNPKLLKSHYWAGHIPFAFELVRRLRPKLIVELGTYSGTSLAAFCQAAKELQFPTKCYGVDLWEGDIHMAPFESSLFPKTLAYFNNNYPSIALLVKKSFDDALLDFPDGSIDLLHLDGTHTYEAVTHDFNYWLPKLSPTAVLLVHDTCVDEKAVGDQARLFGVRQFFDEQKLKFPHIEFTHSYGLGVILVGSDQREQVLNLVTLLQERSHSQYFRRMGQKRMRQAMFFERLAFVCRLGSRYFLSGSTK